MGHLCGGRRPEVGRAPCSTTGRAHRGPGDPRAAPAQAHGEEGWGRGWVHATGDRHRKHPTLQTLLCVRTCL
jgi:hypothetical protein